MPSGEVRIRLKDVAPRKGAADAEVLQPYKLSEILRGAVVLVDGKGEEVVRLKPLTLYGLATLEDLYEPEGGIAVLAVRKSNTRDFLRFATVLANQELPAEDQMTEAEIGNLVSASNYKIVSQLVEEAIAPLFEALAEIAAATPRAAGAPGGAGSSTGSLISSAGKPIPSGVSPSPGS